MNALTKHKKSRLTYMRVKRNMMKNTFLSGRLLMLKSEWKQDGIYSCCKQHFEYNEMQGDHIIPWAQGGRTVDENLQMLCQKCNNDKSDK